MASGEMSGTAQSSKLGQSPHDWVVGSGEMPGLIRSHDWSTTPLGPLETWASALRFSVNSMLSSSVPVALLLGEQLLLIFNDSCRKLMVDFNSNALGRPAGDVWLQHRFIDDVVKHKVLRRHELIVLENQRFSKDTWFTLLCSPIQPEDDQFGGMQVAFIETTRQRNAELELRETSQNMRALLDASVGLVAMIDADGRILSMNMNAARSFGKNPAEMVGLCLFDMFPAELASRRRMRLREVIDARKPINFEDKRGNQYRATTLFPISGNDGRVTRVMIVAQDITPRKESEERLKRSEQKFRNLFNNTQVAMLHSRLDGSEILEANEKFLELIGRSRDETIGKSSAIFWAEPDRRAEMMQLLKERGRLVDYEFKMVKKDGALRDCLTSVTFYREQGLLDGSIRDITDEKRAEGALRRSEVKYRTLYETLPDGFATVDANGCISEFNDSFQRMLGYSQQELASMTYRDITLEKWHSVEERILKEQALVRGYTDIYEKEYRRKDGASIPVELRTVAIRDEKNRPSGYWAIIRNVSKRKKLEQELRSAIELRDEFMSIASHELKTPLAALYMQLQTLNRLTARKGAVSDLRIGTMSKGALGSARAINALLNELLDVTRIRAGRLTLEKQEMDMREALLENVAFAAEAARRSGSVISVRADCAARGRWDRTRINQVLSNLLSNAIKYGEGKPIEVTLLVDREANVVRICITDHGIGISKEMQTKIFQRFQRAERTGKISGLGLGLYVSRQIVEAHGGSIRVESELGEGSLFVVELPTGLRATHLE
jgi:PAS domain S-box-containing protein